MSTAKQAFTAVREAKAAVDGLKNLRQLQLLQRKALGWDSEVTKFRKDAEARLVDLERGHPQKKLIKKQLADLRFQAGELRDLFNSKTEQFKTITASKRENRSASRENKLINKLMNAWDALNSFDSTVAKNTLARMAFDVKTDVTEQEMSDFEVTVEEEVAIN